MSKLFAHCPACHGEVPLENTELEGVYSGKCPYCHKPRMFDVNQENGKTTFTPVKG